MSVSRTGLATLVVALAMTPASCGGGDPPPAGGGDPAELQQQVNRPMAVPDTRPQIEPYEPLDAEELPDAKRIAARAAQRAVTYRRGAKPAEVAESIGPSAAGPDALAEIIAPVVEPGMRSAGEVCTPSSRG